MFILTYIKAWGILVPPIFCAWLFICMIIRSFFLKWDSVRGEYIMPEKKKQYPYAGFLHIDYTLCYRRINLVLVYSRRCLKIL